CLGLGACVTPGQAPPPPPVTEAEMRATVGVLGSDAFEGRTAGTEGETKAAAYIAERFRAGGLTAPEGGYLQGFQVNRGAKELPAESVRLPAGQRHFMEQMNKRGPFTAFNVVA